MTPAHTDIIVVETQARALRAAYFLRMISVLAARLRPAGRTARV